MFRWNSAYSVGIDSIDNQHKTMFSYGKKIESLISNFDDSDISQNLIDIFSELIEYTKVHFNFEESLMKSANYENYEAHVKKHEFILAQLIDINTSVESSTQAATAFSLLQLVAQWIFEHIQGDDLSYKTCVSNYIDSKNLFLDK